MFDLKKIWKNIKFLKRNDINIKFFNVFKAYKLSDWKIIKKYWNPILFKILLKKI